MEGGSIVAIIEMKKLTKDYGHGRGIFDLNLSIEEGEVFGVVGANGAGKTTTIRLLMGFMQPSRGSAAIGGLDCWADAATIKKRVGYIPDEVAFPDASTGVEFLRQQAALLGVKDMSYAGSLIHRLQLDPTANLKRMSKGMKQKTAIVASLLADPEILIYDEPTTGLDPLMRSEFLEILKEQKQRGKTIFMSTHIIEEVEQICDRVALISDGRLIAVKSTKEMKHRENKVYKLVFRTPEDYQRFLSESFDTVDTAERQDSPNEVIIHVHDREINRLMRTLRGYQVKSLSEVKFSLEQELNSLLRRRR